MIAPEQQRNSTLTKVTGYRGMMIDGIIHFDSLDGNHSWKPHSHSDPSVGLATYRLIYSSKICQKKRINCPSIGWRNRLSKVVPAKENNYIYHVLGESIENDFIWTKTDMIGFRSTMEDADICLSSLPSPLEGKPLHVKRSAVTLNKP